MPDVRLPRGPNLISCVPLPLLGAARSQVDMTTLTLAKHLQREGGPWGAKKI